MCSLSLAALALLSWSLTDAAFLEEKLPLRPTITTPMEIMTSPEGASVFLSGSQALTAVFMRPVIALGSDFGSEDGIGGKVPFELSCTEVPGKFRWTTTTIARFDADVPWPTDLECQLSWNQELMSHDGLTVNLTGVPLTRKLTTNPLRMMMGTIISELAENVTGGIWAGETGAPDDLLPEVPPDGRIVVNFNYDVHLGMLQNALLMSSTDSDHVVPLKVGPCTTPRAEPWFAAADADASFDMNSTCVEVMPQETLKLTERYELTLPSGTKYHAMAGATKTSNSLTVYGLRPFKFPFLVPARDPDVASQLVYSGAGNRRLDAWLVHGLSNESMVPALAENIVLCEIEEPSSRGSDCTDVNFTLSLHNKATVRLDVPGLLPHRKYSISVKASDSVIDGFNLPLEESSTTFWSTDIYPFFTAPQTSYNFISLEMNQGPVEWPFLSLGARGRYDQSEAAAWRLNLDSEGKIATLLGLMNRAGSLHAKDVLGNPDITLDRTETDALSGDFAQDAIPLGDGDSPAVHVVHTCCTSIMYPTSRIVSSSIKTITQSRLAATIIMSVQGMTAWVTNTMTGLPVSGAVARVYLMEYSTNMRPEKMVARCTTGDAGYCQANLTGTRKESMYMTLTGVVTSRGHVTFVPSLYWYSGGNRQPYTGTIVLDRAVVKPGDSVHITGYIQEIKVGRLSLPENLKEVSVSVNVGEEWTSVSPSMWTVDVDQEHGSFHLELPVPESAAMGEVYLNVNAQAGKQMVSVASSSFTVADPRQPTAELELTAPTWALPDSQVDIQVQATSYIGASLAGEVMTLRWSTSKGEGLIEIKTASDGSGAATIDLSVLTGENATRAGEILSVDVEWIGPTRERLSKSAYVGIEAAAQQVDLNLLPQAYLPGLPFGVTARLFDRDTGADISGRPITVVMTLLVDDAEGADEECMVNASCTVMSGGSDPRDCQMMMPCMGRYVLEGCYGDSGDVCANITVGKNESEWQKSPLAWQPGFVLTIDRTAYNIGDTAHLDFQNYWPGAAVFLMWGNEWGMEKKVYGQLPVGVQRMSVVLGDECEGGCSLVASLAVPRLREDDYPLASLVPSSKLFDPLAPHEATYQIYRIEIMEKRTLDVVASVETESGVPIIADGEVANISVQVTLEGEPVPDAEVTVLAVDKSWLDLLPYPLRPQLAEELMVDLATQISMMNSYEQRLAPHAIREVFSAASRRLGLDPWISPYVNVQPQSYLGSDAADVDVSDEEYLARYASPITYFAQPQFSVGGGGGCGGMRGGPCYYAYEGMEGEGYFYDAVGNVGGSRESAIGVGPPKAAKIGAGGGSAGMEDESSIEAPGNAGSSSQPTARTASDFKATPMFVVLRTTADGSGLVQFEGPPSLGTYSIRAYAAEGKRALYGAAETELIVRREVSFTPLLPRFARVGDTFQAGVIITDSAANESRVIDLMVSPKNGSSGGSVLKLTSEDVQAVELNSSHPLEAVYFEWEAVSIGSKSIDFYDVNGQGDYLVLQLDVIPQQTAVQVATSFAINASDMSDWAEGVLLPDAVPGSGSLDLIAGVGYFPAQEGMMMSSVHRYDGTDNGPEASSALLIASWPLLYDHYSQTPSSELLANASMALDDLDSLDGGLLGLLWRMPDQWWTPTRCDVVLNSWAAWTVAGLGDSVSFPEWNTRTELFPIGWGTSAAKQLTKDAIASREEHYHPGPYCDFHTLAWVKLQQGIRWTPAVCGGARPGVGGSISSCAPQQVVEDLHTDRLMANVKNMSDLQTRLLVAIACQESLPRIGHPECAAFVANLSMEVLSSMRVQGRTAYISAYKGSKSSAPLTVQALALLMLTNGKVVGAAQLVQKLAVWVAAGQVMGVQPYTMLRPSAMAVSLASKALTAYDAASGSTTPNLTFTAAAGAQQLLSASFNAETKEVASSSTAWEDLPPAPTNLTFSAVGTGEVSVVASLDFVPREIIPFPLYRGIWVEAAVQLIDPLTRSPSGPARDMVPLGSVVMITIQVTTPDDIGAATVEALMPAGLEPLDPNVASGTASTCVLGGLGVSWNRYFWWWWWPVCPRQETRPDVVTFQYVNLMAGTSTIQFQAVAATAGTFVRPPIKAFAEQQPELMGASAGGSFVVSLGALAEGEGVVPQAVTKGCEDTCGMCRIDTGECLD